MITGLMRFVARAEEARRTLERVPTDIPRPDLGSMLRELAESVQDKFADEWVSKFMDAIGQDVLEAAKNGQTKIEINHAPRFREIRWKFEAATGFPPSRDVYRATMNVVAAEFKKRGIRFAKSRSYYDECDLVVWGER